MSIFSKKIRISLFTTIAISVLIALAVCGYIFYQSSSNTKLNSIFSGLLTGLIIALIQLFLSWYEYKKIDKFTKMNVIDIKSDRDDRDFYEKLIKNSKQKIDIMGVTASRFIIDFADAKSDREESRVLFQAMDNGVRIKILLPKEEYLENQKQKDDARNMKLEFDSIKNKYQSVFDVKYFDHLPMHSIFIIDDECILGPVFPGVSSKDTPAIQLKNNSPYAVKYLKYFENEWAIAQN